jgi:uncharacterized protein (TIGR03437 family)
MKKHVSDLTGPTLLAKQTGPAKTVWPAKKIRPAKQMYFQWLLLALAVLSSSSAFAQSVIQTRVTTSQPGAYVWIDGVRYQGGESFLWTEGSAHVLEVVTPVQSINTMSGPPEGVQYTFTGWTERSGRVTQLAGNRVVVVATSAVAEYVATFELQVLVNVTMPTCVFLPGVDLESRPPQIPYPSPTEPQCLFPGRVIFNGTPLTTSYSGFVAPPSVLTLQAYPSQGFVFNGFYTTFGNGQAPVASFTPPLISQTNLGRIQVTPRFERAHRVRFRTKVRGCEDPCPSDAGLRMFLDGGQVQTPVANGIANVNDWVIRDWLPGSTHLLAGVSPQQDSMGRYWVFEGWQLGGGRVSTSLTTPVVAGPASSYFELANEITAVYAPGRTFHLSSQPSGLKLKVNGVESPAYAFWASVGTKFEIEAPEQVTGADGRRYQFRAWSNGGPRMQTVDFTEDMANSGRALTALYDVLGRVTFQTNPAGIPLEVDGRNCNTPCSVDKASGQSVRVSARQTIGVDGDSRHEFIGWADTETAARQVTVNSGIQNFQANYRSAYRLRVTSNPADQAEFSLQPATSDGFFPAGQEVIATVTPKRGWELKWWRGDVSGSGPTERFLMERPMSATAILTEKEIIKERGVRNAAGETVDGGVAPGSIVTFFGGKLAGETAVAQRNPIYPQLLANTSVRVAGRLLPLLFVDKEQINAVLPFSVPEGPLEAVITSAGMQEVVIPFESRRNAPGLFADRVQDRDFITGFRPNGSKITAANPARRGETIRLLGTGFGPFRNAMVEGFPASDTRNPLADNAEVVFGDQVIPATAVYATPGEIGLTSMELLINERFPAASSIEIQVRVNGRLSNKVLLPVQ